MAGHWYLVNVIKASQCKRWCIASFSAYMQKGKWLLFFCLVKKVKVISYQLHVFLQSCILASVIFVKFTWKVQITPHSFGIGLNMQNPNKEKSHECAQCGKSFGRPSNLMQHIRTHSEEKPFKCRQCNKSFNQLSNLKEHQLTHTGAKQFKCKVCDKSFGINANLKAHMLTHT